MAYMTNSKSYNQILNGDQTNPRKVVLEMMLSYVKPQLLYVAAKLGIADLLEASPQSFEQITGSVEAEPTALYRLLLGLVNIGVLCEIKGKFGLTEQGEYLVKGKAGSLHDIIVLQGEEIFQAWGQLLYSVQTGKPAFEHVFGTEFFKYLAQNPQSQARFNAFMSGTSRYASRAFTEIYNFDQIQKVIDVGGSNGVLLSTILQANPHLSGILFDIATTGKHLVEIDGVRNRCKIVKGDFFQNVPSDGDIYILSQIIHDWDDARSLKILQNCHAAMNKTSRLVLFEHIMPQDLVSPNPAIERDLVMLVLTGGRERTENEFRTLLGEANFKLTQIIPTRHCRSIIEAIPV